MITAVAGGKTRPKPLPMMPVPTTTSAGVLSAVRARATTPWTGAAAPTRSPEGREPTASAADPAKTRRAISAPPTATPRTGP
jgi:hypothetical protein